MIARHNARYSVEVTTENILITSGSQQALDFIGRLFINRGDYIVVESPTYLGALQAGIRMVRNISLSARMKMA